MANKFTAGMKNVVEVLNQMWDAFAAGPYNAVPLTGGTMTGPLTAPKVIATSDVTVVAVGVAAQEVLRLSVVSGTEGNARTVIKMGYPTYGYGTRMVSGGDPTLAFAGYTAFEFGNGSAGYAEAMRISQRGALIVGDTRDDGKANLQVWGGAAIVGKVTLKDSSVDLLAFANHPNSRNFSFGQIGEYGNFTLKASLGIGGDAYVGKDIMIVTSTGRLLLGGAVDNGVDTIQALGRIFTENLSVVNKTTIGVPNTEPETVIKLDIANCARFSVSGGAYGSSAAAALVLSANGATGRSINAGGTINASGADYAEYMTKGALCNVVPPGALVGVDAEGKLTDKWSEAVSFVVKSTNPCMVGGDSWMQHLGERPPTPERIARSVKTVLVSEAVAGVAAVHKIVDGELIEITHAVAEKPPEYVNEEILGDSDDEWAAKQAPGVAFDLALELARAAVDRIAFCGQVPCNIYGAVPGQYILPIQDGEGIAGLAVDEDDMTHKLYMRSIGKVIAIEDDGRARIIVKVA